MSSFDPYSLAGDGILSLRILKAALYCLLLTLSVVDEKTGANQIFCSIVVDLLFVLWKLLGSFLSISCTFIEHFLC